MDVYYEPGKSKSGLKYNPFKSCCVPRPIGWISTVSSGGIPNLAPYSQFQNVSYDPPVVMIAASCRPDGSLKDTVKNILDTGEFVWNMATFDLARAVVGSAVAFDPAVDEFKELDLETVPSRSVKPVRVKASPVQFECRLKTSLYFPCNTAEANTYVIFGDVVGIHIQDDCIKEDRIDLLKIKPLARVGYLDYICVDSSFQLESPHLKPLSTVPFLQE
jgi:flavin reductase (DIM6/NTAB) family NADH-FMN oxidoreductase RutF